MYGILSIINIVKLAETLAFLRADPASWGNQVFEATPRNTYIFFVCAFCILVRCTEQLAAPLIFGSVFF